jgi:hypothetical protein
VPSRAATPAPSAETPITERPIIFQILLALMVVSTAFEKLHCFCFSAWLMIFPRLLCPGGRGRGCGRMEIQKETKEGAEGAAGCSSTPRCCSCPYQWNARSSSCPADAPNSCACEGWAAVSTTSCARSAWKCSASSPC